MRVLLRHLTLVVAVAVLVTALPGVAAADTVRCPSAKDLYQPFLGFGDPASYFLAPGGSFEDGASWSGGRTVAGNEPYHVRRGGAGDRRSLAIGPSGATSPQTCIGLGSPTIRYFAVRTAGAATAALGVSVSFTGTDGQPHMIGLVPVVAPSTGTWVVSAPTPILVNLTVLPQPTGIDLTSGLPTAGVRFTFTPSPGSSWRVDDVFVDPYQRN